MLNQIVAQKSEAITHITIQAGDYATYPISGNKVTIVYEGKMKTKKNTHSFIIVDEPIEITLDDSDCVLGLSLGIKKMCLGETAIIEVPYQLGYGEEGNDMLGILPKTDLIYRVSLIKIE